MWFHRSASLGAAVAGSFLAAPHFPASQPCLEMRRREGQRRILCDRRPPPCNLHYNGGRVVQMQATRPRKVVAFFMETHGEPYKEFSNWFEGSAPFEFKIPSYAHREGFPETVWCWSAEKAIMVTKASLMGDRQSFDAIVEASDQAIIKALGRKVTPFIRELWDQYLESTAFEIVLQKFQADEGLRELLLSTGDALICEASPWDRIWGIGLAVQDPRTLDPAQWEGRNVLGEALMRVREHFRLQNLNKAPTEVEVEIATKKN